MPIWYESAQRWIPIRPGSEAITRGELSYILSEPDLEKRGNYFLGSQSWFWWITTFATLIWSSSSPLARLGGLRWRGSLALLGSVGVCGVWCGFHALLSHIFGRDISLIFWHVTWDSWFYLTTSKSLCFDMKSEVISLVIWCFSSRFRFGENRLMAIFSCGPKCWMFWGFEEDAYHICRMPSAPIITLFTSVSPKSSLLQNFVLKL